MVFVISVLMYLDVIVLNKYTRANTKLVEVMVVHGQNIVEGKMNVH